MIKFVNRETFDVMEFLAEDSVMKPEPEINKQASALFGIDPKEEVFVNNRWSNIQGTR